MKLRRQLLFAGAIGAILPAGVFAQARAPRIGMLGPRPLADSTYVPGVVRRLAELGYRDGAGMVLEYRSSDGFAGRYPKQARELIDLKCDLIFAIGPEAPVRALQDARSPAPIVFLAVDYDPLEKGYGHRERGGTFMRVTALGRKRTSTRMLGSDNANYRNQTLHDVDAGYVLHHFAAEVLSGLRPAERSNGAAAIARARAARQPLAPPTSR